MIEAIKLMLRERTLLDVYFIDGTVKRFDVLSLKDKYPQLEQLKNRNLFEKGKLLGWSAIYWNDELDIDTDYIYEHGGDVTEEYDNIESVIIGFQIKEKRLELELSQEELAKRAGIDQSDLSKLEKGLLNPSIKLISRVVKGLNGKLDLSIH